MNDIHIGPPIWCKEVIVEPCIYWMNSEGQIWRINADGEWEKVSDI